MADYKVATLQSRFSLIYFLESATDFFFFTIYAFIINVSVFVVKHENTFMNHVLILNIGLFSILTKDVIIVQHNIWHNIGALDNISSLFYVL